MAGITARLSPSGVIRARMLSNHIRTQERAVVPQPQDQVIIPDAGYDGFAKVPLCIDSSMSYARM